MGFIADVQFRNQTIRNDERQKRDDLVRFATTRRDLVAHDWIECVVERYVNAVCLASWHFTIPAQCTVPRSADRRTIYLPDSCLVGTLAYRPFTLRRGKVL